MNGCRPKTLGWAILNGCFGHSLGDEEHRRELAESCLRVHLVATTRYQVDRDIHIYGFARQCVGVAQKPYWPYTEDACEGGEVVLALAQQEVL